MCLLTGEVKQGKVNGFHNWLFFLTMEMQDKVDYYGFNYALSFRGKGAVIKSVFEWDGMVKPVRFAKSQEKPVVTDALFLLVSRSVPSFSGSAPSLS